MVSALINLVVVLLIVGVIWWAIEQLLPMIPLPEPIARVVRVLLIVILVLIIIFALLGLLPGGGGGYGFRLIR